MAAAIMDSCCLLDLLASGCAEAILRACGHEWHVPVAVRDEVHFIRQRDPADPSKFVSAPADLSGLIATGALKPCQPDAQLELDLFVHYAARFGSDGEAMCLALAESRGWLVATDDKEAITVAQRAGLSVVSSPQLLKAWSLVADAAEVIKALLDIELFAWFRPNPAMPECRWWLEKTEP